MSGRVAGSPPAALAWVLAALALGLLLVAFARWNPPLDTWMFAAAGIGWG